MSLIVLEGLDGSGKGTQCKLLLQALRKRGVPCRKVDFPDYASPSSALVKMYLNGEFGGDPGAVNPYAAGTFYAVDRFASFEKSWRAAYEAGEVILADRYTTANYIYQMGKLPREQWEQYAAWVEDLEYGKLGLPRPDRVLYLEMPVEVSQELLSLRYRGDEEKKDIHEKHLDYLRLCRESADFAAGQLGWQRIDCARDGRPLSVEEIHQAVLCEVLPLLKR